MQSSLAIQEQSQPFAERCVTVVLLVFVKPRRPGPAAVKAASVTALKHKRENMALGVGWWAGISDRVNRSCPLSQEPTVARSKRLHRDCPDRLWALELALTPNASKVSFDAVR